MIIGVRAHGKNGIKMPVSEMEKNYNRNNDPENCPTLEYHGLEIICKVLNDDEETDDKEILEANERELQKAREIEARQEEEKKG